MITYEQANKIRSLFNGVMANALNTKSCQPEQLGTFLGRTSDSRKNLDMFLESLTEEQPIDVEGAVSMGLDRYNEAFLTIATTECGKND